MNADSPSQCLVERLTAALDRLEIALEGTETRLREADAASAVLTAMAEDRAALAVDLDAARAKAAELSAAAGSAEAEVAEAAGAVKDVLAGADAFGETSAAEAPAPPRERKPIFKRVGRRGKTGKKKGAGT